MGLVPQKTIVCVIGTRPEAIKMAPVIHALKGTSWARCRVLLTGQHREMADQALKFFAIDPDIDLDVMRLKLSLDRLAAHLVTNISATLAFEQPEIVLAQGDTTTVVATAIACCHQNIPFGHVEAGLRTRQLFAPFPEEANRVVASHLSALNFAPTMSARANLEREGISPDTIFVTGNTVIDSLLMTADRDLPIGVDLDPDKRLLLVTAHRRESFGEPIRQICRAVAILHERFADVEFLWPVHPNPAIQSIVTAMLSRRPRIHLVPPLDYGPFVSAIKRSTLVLTDSGGIQEEAPALGKPVLVLRAESERPEAIASGVARLVGHDSWTIVEEVSRLLAESAAYGLMAQRTSPYGDGHAARRIVSVVHNILGVDGMMRIAG
jgi:UDP-N-acetylglucosamine 2-epimerase (non-hydrolysing)